MKCVPRHGVKGDVRRSPCRISAPLRPARLLLAALMRRGQASCLGERAGGVALGWAGMPAGIGWLGVLRFQGLGDAAVVFGGADDLIVKGYVYYRAYLVVWVGSHFPVFVFPRSAVAGGASWVRSSRHPVGFKNCWDILQ